MHHHWTTLISASILLIAMTFIVPSHAEAAALLFTATALSAVPEAMPHLHPSAERAARRERS